MGMDPRISEAEFIALSDVTSPLCGPKGASVVFGPQKGAGSDMIKVLDSNLYHYGQAIEALTGIDVINAPGSGAGGGIGAGLIAFCNAKIQSGVDVILNMLNFDRCLNDADLVITGEGRIDLQTAAGKLPQALPAEQQNMEYLLLRLSAAWARVRKFYMTMVSMPW